MKTAHVCFLWHMHQPYYTDPVTGTASMPWVRLHATKAYFDMGFLPERFSAARATFNFTPSLLTQLNELASGAIIDLFFDHARKPAADLNPAERVFLLRHFFAANWATMVRPFPRYHELLVKRGLDLPAHDLDRVARSFTTQDLLDLQVWHNLAWFGYGALSRYPRLGELREKDRGFTEENKQEVFSIQREVIAAVIPLYRRLAESGQIELTTSPFFHPILPLVIDTDFARRARPETPLPSRFHEPEDAEQQIRNAVALHTAVFGRPPQGLWPSEGSVSPEMIPMLYRNGLRWTATDEGVLARSLGQWDRQAALYRPYRIGQPREEVSILFRDREISDAIGFAYSKSTSEAAVENFLQRLTAIIQHAPGDQVLIPIILDGENPWEHYHDGGERFLSGLYAHLGKGSRQGDGWRVEMETIGGSLDRSPPTIRLATLHSGSWINADFHIWIGHPEDNRAWELLRETRARLVQLSKRLDAHQAKSAWEALYAAEGSDWFWWYGDDFHTEYKLEFDLLFRTHLRNVFICAGVPVPEFLNEPIFTFSPSTERSVRLPVRLLAPIIDGTVTNFFEWRGAGSIDPMPPLGAMWKPSNFFDYIGFGYNLEELFVRLDPRQEGIEEGTLAGQGRQVELHITVPEIRHKLVFPLPTVGMKSFTLYSALGEGGYSEVRRYGTICAEKIIELAMPFKDLSLQAGKAFKLSLAIIGNGLELERYPRHHSVMLTVPDHNFDAVMWRV